MPALPATEPHPADIPDLPHEMLGAALMRGPADAATFQAIRCGAMGLSDLGNSPQRIAEAADYFKIANRVAHLARLGLNFARHPQSWQAVLDALPPAASGEDFLPGLSRFTSETGMRGLGRGSSRTWLRTRYAR